MRFWDSSAIVPLFVEQKHSSRVKPLLEEDPAVVVWWGTEVECASAFARLVREGRLKPELVSAALDGLAALRRKWVEIQPLPDVRDAALRFVRTYPLRAADALQLAAAYVAADLAPPSLEIVTLDVRLAGAARLEGFARVLPA